MSKERPPHKDLGKKIEIGRINKELSKTQVRDALSSPPGVITISADGYNKWENGIRRPQPETLLKLCDILNLDYMSIMETAGFLKTKSGANVEMTQNAGQAEIASQQSGAGSELTKTSTVISEDIPTATKMLFDLILKYADEEYIDKGIAEMLEIKRNRKQRVRG